MEAVDDEVAVAEAVGDPVPLNSIAWRYSYFDID